MTMEGYYTLEGAAQVVSSKSVLKHEGARNLLMNMYGHDRTTYLDSEVSAAVNLAQRGEDDHTPVNKNGTPCETFGGNRRNPLCKT